MKDVRWEVDRRDVETGRRSDEGEPMLVLCIGDLEPLVMRTATARQFFREGKAMLAQAQRELKLQGLAAMRANEWRRERERERGNDKLPRLWIDMTRRGRR